VKITYQQTDMPADLGLWLARLAGFEPATRCLEGTSRGSPDAARNGLMGSLAALIVAGGGTTSPSVCGWWLPGWLPEASLGSLMFERSNVVTIPRPEGHIRAAPVVANANQHDVPDGAVNPGNQRDR